MQIATFRDGRHRCMFLGSIHQLDAGIASECYVPRRACIACAYAAFSAASVWPSQPTSKLIRQILGAVSEFDKAMVVAKLKGARERKRVIHRQEGRGPQEPCGATTRASCIGSPIAPQASQGWPTITKGDCCGAYPARSLQRTWQAILGGRRSIRCSVNAQLRERDNEVALMLADEYALEKLRQAVGALATGSGRVQERLADAAVFLIRVRREDIADHQGGGELIGSHLGL